ncbi:uncharacterized protein LOC117647371 [Thrips palmi]|uniref:Uncharacterized protein LOC117647371 n=1 Tax=Thrips palmi TaxID=161013 RepID=A0A6P8Z4F9_THRPL|nr:uncharacterized protein LOC117647371 [Thrips palmi]
MRGGRADPRRGPQARGVGSGQTRAPQQAALGTLRTLVLSCPLAAIPGLKDLPLVAKCASLRSLNLTVDECPYNAESLAAAAFLRAATHLEELVLQYQIIEDCNVDVDVPVEQGLLPALASSGRASLRKLVLNWGDFRNDRRVTELASALPGLPALEWLVLPHVVPRRVLPAINPGSAPRLRGLSLPSCMVKCAHGALHEPDVCRILASYRHFYLVVGIMWCGEEGRCEHCAKGCHGLPLPIGKELVGFYTHEAPSKEAVDGLSLKSVRLTGIWD